MKAEIALVTDIATGRQVPMTYLNPETEADVEQLRMLAEAGQAETQLNPQDLEADLDGDDERENRADALTDAEAASIRELLEVSLQPDTRRHDPRKPATYCMPDRPRKA